MNLASVSLIAANGMLIRAFCHQRKTIKIGDNPYSFVFLITQVPRPILGLDFLQAFGMMIDLAKRRLIHAGMSTRFSSAFSTVSGVKVVHSSLFVRLLDDYPEITDATLAASSSRHGVECFIETTGLLSERHLGV